MNSYAVIATAIVATLLALGGAAVATSGNATHAGYVDQTMYVYEVSVENPRDGQDATYTESYVVTARAGGYDVKVYVDYEAVDSYTAGPEWLAGIRDVSGMEYAGTLTVECMGMPFEAVKHEYALSGGWGSVASANGMPLVIEESQMWSGGVIHTESRILVAIQVPNEASDGA